MSNLLCHTGNWGSVGSLGAWGWIGIILNLIFWIGLFAGLTLLIVRALRNPRVPAAVSQPTAKEMLQTQYARGEISREEYELRKRDI
jgi:putative membrane protein